jgi:uncharacterized membrane protein
MDTIRRIHLLNLALLVWIWVFSILKWPELPERIPVHFNMAGEADGWADKSWEHWFLIPLVAVGMTLLLYGSAWLAARFPQHANLPSRVKLADLPPEERGPLLDVIKELLYRIAALITVQFVLMQLSTYRVAVGESEALPWYVRISTIGIVVLTLLLTLTTMLRLRSMIRSITGSSQNKPTSGGAAA